MKIDASGLALAQHNRAESGQPCDCPRCTALYVAEANRCGVPTSDVIREVRFYMEDIAGEGH